MQNNNFPFKTTTHNYTGEITLTQMVQKPDYPRNIPEFKVTEPDYDEEAEEYLFTEEITFQDYNQLTEFLEYWMKFTIHTIIHAGGDDDCMDNIPAFMEQSRELLIQLEDLMINLDNPGAIPNYRIYPLVTKLFNQILHYQTTDEAKLGESPDAIFYGEIKPL